MIFEASTKDMAILDASAHGKVCEKYKSYGPPKKWSVAPLAAKTPPKMEANLGFKKSIF